MAALTQSIEAPGTSALITLPRGAWPTRDAISAAVALFPRERTPEKVIQVDWLARDERRLAAEVAGVHPALHCERLLVEGPQWRIEVGPGVVSVRRSDPARSERTLQRMAVEARCRAEQLTALLEEHGPDYRAPDARVQVVTEWSRKSRALMMLRMAEFDFAAGFAAVDDSPRRLAMVTLTYPGDWLTVAPGPDACRRHLDAFRKRWERRWGPLTAVWKREFQRRGAPHYHLGCMVPEHPDFLSWLSATWADVVDHPDPRQKAAHMLAGTGVDFDKGARSSDPRRFAAYFSKHGIFAAKDYQNTPPAEWATEEGVGRFWGAWRLRRVVGSVHVAPDVAQSVVRAARRWSEASRPRVKVYRWRKVTTVDRETGELGWKWRRRRTTVPVKRLTRSAGYLTVNDGPAFAAALSRVATAAAGSGRRLSGPVGFLP